MKVFESRIGRYPPALYLYSEASLMDVFLGMASKRVRHCPLVDADGKLVGMISARDVVDFLGGRRFQEVVKGRFGGDVLSALRLTRALELSYKPPFVYLASDLREVIEIMLERGVGAIAVVDENKYLRGLISERHLVSLFANIETHVKVKEVMTGNFVGLTPSDTLERGMQVMSEYRVRRIPLVSGGVLYGIVTVKDILAFLSSEDSLKSLEKGAVEAVYQVPLSYIASRPVITVDPEEDVGRAISIMKAHNIGALMVTVNEKPVGIITERDIMSRLPRVKGVETFIDEIRQEIYASRVSF